MPIGTARPQGTSRTVYCSISTVWRSKFIIKRWQQKSDVKFLKRTRNLTVTDDPIHATLENVKNILETFQVRHRIPLNVRAMAATDALFQATLWQKWFSPVVWIYYVSEGRDAGRSGAVNSTKVSKQATTTSKPSKYLLLIMWNRWHHCILFMFIM